MTLAELPPPWRAPIGVVDPLGVARRELALIEVLRARPGAALVEIAEAAGHTRSATADRLRRLAARGAVVKVAGRWRLAGEEPDEPDAIGVPICRYPQMLRRRDLSPKTHRAGCARSRVTCAP
jgi:hypothetical protein